MDRIDFKKIADSLEKTQPRSPTRQLEFMNAKSQGAHPSYLTVLLNSAVGLL